VRLAEPIDQATGLRRLFAGGSAFHAVGILGPDGQRNARVCAELAQGLARRGNRVLVLDEARPPYNVGGMWGLLPRHSLADVPGIGLARAVMDAGPGIRLLATPDAMRTLAGLHERVLRDLAEQWQETPEWMLVNGLGGLRARNACLAMTADTRVLVLPGERDWLAEAYAVLKTGHTAWPGGRWQVLVENADPEAARRLYHSLRGTAMRFLGLAPDYLGSLSGTRLPRGDAHAGLLAESLQAAQPINFEQFWQRMWLFSRMAMEPAAGKGIHAGRYPG